MSTVFKYVIARLPGSLSVSLPRNAEVLSFGCQRNELVFWAKVDPTSARETRQFQLVWTGDEFSDRRGVRFIGTTQTPDGLVWHLFEDPR